MSDDNRLRASARTVGSFFRLLELDFHDVHEHPDAMDRLRTGDLHGVVVHRVYEPDLLRQVVERLERHDPPFIKTWFPEAFRAWFFGCNLNLTDPDLDDYFAESPRFRAQLESLFPPSMGLAEHLAGGLSRLDRGRPYLPPPGLEPGQVYMPTTIRAHLEGGYIPAHVDNEQAVRPSYVHLRSLVSPHMLSFVLALNQPVDGGALEVFNARVDPLATTTMNDDRAVNKPNVEEYDSVLFQLPAGTMIVLDSGRYLHRVTPVIGNVKRWTMCSFMALNRAGNAMHYWG